METPRPRAKRNKRSYSGLSAAEVFTLVGRKYLTSWEIDVPPRLPSPTLLEVLKRLNSFMITASEAGKEMLIDALLAEIVPEYPRLRVWKGEPLETEMLTGITDYLFAPFQDYLSTPLLCAVEAKRDDFEGGETLCIAEMYACRQRNEGASLKTDLHGIVSNGQGWVFYRWMHDDSEFNRTGLLSLDGLPRLLGVIAHVCEACQSQIPSNDPSR